MVSYILHLYTTFKINFIHSMMDSICFTWHKIVIIFHYVALSQVIKHKFSLFASFFITNNEHAWPFVVHSWRTPYKFIFTSTRKMQKVCTVHLLNKFSIIKYLLTKLKGTRIYYSNKWIETSCLLMLFFSKQILNMH